MLEGTPSSLYEVYYGGQWYCVEVFHGIRTPVSTEYSFHVSRSSFFLGRTISRTTSRRVDGTEEVVRDQISDDRLPYVQ